MSGKIADDLGGLVKLSSISGVLSAVTSEAGRHPTLWKQHLHLDKYLRLPHTGLVGYIMLQTDTSEKPRLLMMVFRACRVLTTHVLLGEALEEAVVTVFQIYQEKP